MSKADQTALSVITERDYRHTVRTLATIKPGDSPESVIDTRAWLDASCRWLDEIRDTFEARMVEWIEEEHDGSVDVGDVRYYTSAITKKEKLRDRDAAIDDALTITMGDVEKFQRLLVAQPLKPGECEEVLGKEFRAKHFAKTKTTKLKEGKPEKTIRAVETKYLPTPKEKS